MNVLYIGLIDYVTGTDELPDNYLIKIYDQDKKKFVYLEYEDIKKLGDKYDILDLIKMIYHLRNIINGRIQSNFCIKYVFDSEMYKGHSFEVLKQMYMKKVIFKYE